MNKYKRNALLYILLLLAPMLMALILYKTSDKSLRFSQYLKLQFAPRVWAHRLNSYLQYNLMKNYNIGNVHIGKNNWLFYVTKTDGDSHSDFFAHDRSNLIADWTDYLRESIEKPFGFKAEYLFLSPPNKSSVYMEKVNYLFLDVIPRNRGLYSRLRSVFNKKYAKHFVDVYPVMKSGKKTEETYSPLDSHWNKWGAYLAHVDIMKKTSKLLKEDFSLKEIDQIKKVRVTDPAGDILNMLRGVKKYIGYEKVEDLEVNLSVQDGCCEEPIERVGEIYIVYNNSSANYVVWFIGDSFSIALRKYLSSYFKYVIFMHISNNALMSLMKTANAKYGAPDLIIEERAERYLNLRPVYVNYKTKISENK